MIYFIAESGGWLVKVGFTAGDPSARLRDLQCGNPHELVLVDAMEGYMEDEAALHRHLADRRVRGEWFRLTRDEVDLLREHGAGAEIDAQRSSLDFDRRILRITFTGDEDERAMLRNPEIMAFVQSCASVVDNGRDEYFCPNEVWYGRKHRKSPIAGLKPWLMRLVGWHGETEFRGELQYHKLTQLAYGMLPGCRDCGCEG